MVFIQVSEAQEPKVATIKKLYNKMIEDKHEDILSRMGSIVSQGIINAAGRNATISLTTRDGNLRQNAIVGLMLFMQHWFWYPMLNFITLSLTPTALIGLNKDLKVPKSFKCISNAKPSIYRYPEFIKVDKDKKKDKVATAVLSTTTKAKARKERKEGKQAEPPTPKVPDDTEMADEEKKEAGEKKEEEKEGEKKEEEKKEEVEPDFQELKNPSRVVKEQEKKISYLTEARYHPVLQTRYAGFVILKEVNPPAEDAAPEEYYDDEERDQDAPNPDLQTDLKIPAAFEFDEDVQNGPDSEDD